MQNRTVILMVVSAMSAVALAAVKPAERGPVPTFKSQGYSLACTELDSRSKIDLAEKGEKEHTIAIKGILTVPEKEDVVAVTGKLDVTKVIGTEEKDIRKTRPARRPARGKYTKGSWSFIPLKTRSAEASIDRLKLTGNPYNIRTMSVQAGVVIAGERESKHLSAAVMEDSQEIAAGLSVQITGLRMNAKRVLTLTVKYTRSVGGTHGAFVEQVYALDADGMKIGGGRFAKGDPFARTGALVGTLQLIGTEPHKYFRFIAVTEYKTKTVTFEIKNIFRK